MPIPSDPSVNEGQSLPFWDSTQCLCYSGVSFRNVPGFMGLKLMSMGSEVLVLTCTMAEVGNTRMCVQDVS